MQRVVRNLLLDPMCEENSSVWEKSSTGTITRDQSTRQFGLVSYRLTIWSSDCVYVRQAVTLTPGKSYTLSGYVRSGGPRGVMRIAYTVAGQEITLDSEPGKMWEKTDNMPMNVCRCPSRCRRMQNLRFTAWRTAICRTALRAAIAGSMRCSWKKG